MNTIHFALRVYIAENITKSEGIYAFFGKETMKDKEVRNRDGFAVRLWKRTFFHFPDGPGFDRRCR